MDAKIIKEAVLTLAELYGKSFGGKVSGRYRIPRKLVCDLFERRRIYPEEILLLSRAMMEHGYVLIDMDSFFIVLSSNTFGNYRRVNRDCISRQSAAPKAPCDL
tara:strand:+ start:4245 stop:4556 length:312 start_codon:yes stop_codon:yes gene_type:complete